jgi:hypothetical protein
MGVADMSEVSRGRCKTCGAQIVWVRTESGKWNRPVQEVEHTGYLTLVNGRLSMLTDVFKVHVCTDADVLSYAAEIARREEEKRQWRAKVEAIDCPHRRCTAKATEVCKSLKDGVTPLGWPHPERVKAAMK